MISPSVLFVDDEPRVLEGLRRLLHRQRQSWSMTFLTSAAEALALVEREPVDVLVTDLRMPEMDGVELLARFRQCSPDTIRFVLSGYSQQEWTIQAAGTAHQFLSKPCTALQLRDAVTRAICVKQQLNSEPLRRAISKISTLPSLPQLYEEICALAQSPTSGIGDVAAVVSRDIGMVAKLLQLVNSSFFCLPREVADVRQAIGFMGIETVKTLILTTSLFRSLPLPVDRSTLSQNAFWRHCIQCGQVASRIVQAETNDQRMRDHALTAGLLHDVGKLILATEAPARLERILARVDEHRCSFHEAEAAEGWLSHAEIGGYLLSLWRLPLPVVEAVVFHHSPRHSGVETFNATVAVYAANALLHEQRDGSTRALSLSFVASLGLDTHVERWREITKECLAQAGTGLESSPWT